MRIAPLVPLALCLSFALACQKPADSAPPPAAAPAAAPGQVKQPAEPAPAAVAAPPAAGLDQALAQAIEQLEGKKYREMLERFVAPQDREKALGAAGSWDKLAESFAQGKAPQLLERLQQAKGQRPELSPDGNRAVFAGKPDAPGVAGKDLAWERVDGAWYLRN
ncbi:MAG TPA: hypothetical protein PK668_10290 [Myxococcota bacterium]|nr:hypothetical protein [Myxococcota bacterium]HRY93444.1 hypothetical protein [Myxococcota bacterium]HSA22117.1 hypothetical protein [Myxococcota bacterium]